MRRLPTQGPWRCAECGTDAFITDLDRAGPDIQCLHRAAEALPFALLPTSPLVTQFRCTCGANLVTIQGRPGTVLVYCPADHRPMGLRPGISPDALRKATR